MISLRRLPAFEYDGTALTAGISGTVNEVCIMHAYTYMLNVS